MSVVSQWDGGYAVMKVKESNDICIVCSVSQGSLAWVM